MDNQPEYRKYNPRTTLESQEEMFSEERQVFYYSKFDLFGCNDAEQQFYQFSTFLDRVSKELGNQWQREAHHLFHPHLTSNRVFMTLMELWLNQHPATNILKPSNQITPFNPNFIKRFQKRAYQELTNLSIKQFDRPPSTSLKAVCLGFYMTANEVWQDLFQPQPVIKPEPLSNSLLREVTSTMQSTFKPLMVISEKIKSVFGRKKRKFNEHIEPNQTDSHKFNNCYHQFRKTIDIQKQIQRKMSDLDINFEEDQGMNRDKKIIQKKQFGEEESPIKGSLLGNVYSYVTGFLNRNNSWQVASSFVTQILEMNQVRLEEGKKVKVMRPAQDFYIKLIMVWLMFQKRGETNPSFKEYLTCLTTTFFGDHWHPRYLVPTKYFFERMREDWHIITQEQTVKTEKQMLSSFIHLIRKGMKKQWDQKMQLNQN